MKNIGRSWALGTSLLLHSVIIVALSSGSLQGTIHKQNELVIYLAMPSVGVFQNPKTETHSEYPAIPETANFSLLEPNSQELNVDQVESRIGKTPAVELDEINLISEENEREKLFPEERAGHEPERLPETEVDSLLNPEEVKVVAKPKTIIETSNSDKPNKIINGAEDGFSTDYRSPITDHRPPLLAFAGNPAALGMLARDVLGPDFVKVEVLSLPEPVYPVLSRKRGEEGRVIVEIEISAKGKVLKAEVANSSSYPRLDRAALEAVKKAAFSPATEYGRPVESELKVAYRFKLEN
jgi:protein TonB